MKHLKSIPALLLLFALASPVMATPTGIGSHAGIFAGLRVYYLNDPPTDAAGIPEANHPNRDSCIVDDSIVVSYGPYFNPGPNIISVFPYDPSEVDPEHADIFAIADCMPELVSYVNSNAPQAKVLLDVSPLFDNLRTGGGTQLDPYYQQRAAEFYNIVSSGTHFPQSKMLGLVVRQEAHNFSNGHINNLIANGTQLWTAGNNWRQVDTVAGFVAWDQFFPRSNNIFPWRLDVPVIYEYRTYNPNQPGHALNSGEFEATYSTWLDHLEPQHKVALNVRAFFGDPSDYNAGWNPNHVRWTQLAWCNWAFRQTDVDIAWTVMWTWDSFFSSNPNLDDIIGLQDLIDSSGHPDQEAQSQEYFELVAGLTGSCGI